MAPSEFWRLTYAELRLVLEGCTERRNREMKFQRRLQAWTAAIMVQPHVKERVTPAMLLGEKEAAPAKPKTKAESFDEAVEATRGRVAKTPSVNLFQRIKRLPNGQ